MKLYATVQSERATKGQGGNKHLNIAIHIDEKYPRFRLHVTKRDDDSTDIVLVDLDKPFPNTVFEKKVQGEKGESQTEKTLRNHGFVPENLTANDGSQFVGWSKEKGERQKGESIKCPDCNGDVWDVAKGHKLNKCHNCGLAFD
mgnify:FL=1